MPVIRWWQGTPWKTEFSLTTPSLLERKMLLMTLLSIALVGCMGEEANAQEENEGRTAEEILREGERALAAGEWGNAALLYEAFLRDFASAPESVSLLSRIRYALARCYVGKRDFASALPVIQKALEKAGQGDALAPQKTQSYRNLLLWKGMAELETGDAQTAAASFADLLHSKPPKGQEAQEGEIILLYATALIRAGRMPEAAQLLRERNRLSISEDHRVQMRWLRVEALILGDENRDALEELLQARAHSKTVRGQLLAMTLAQNFMRKNQPQLALRALSLLLPKKEIPWNSSETKGGSGGVLFQEKPTSLPQRQAEAVRRDWKEFEKFRNWDDSILLLRAHAFCELRHYRQAPLALEAMGHPSIQEFLTALRCWLLAENPQRCLDLVQKWTGRFSEASPQFLLSRLLEGTAHLMREDFEAALTAFRSIRNGKFVASARVQEIKALLLSHRDGEALRRIGAFAISESPFFEEILYLKGVAHSNQENYDACRETMSELLQRFPQGERRAAAYFLRASAAHRKMDFPLAIAELQQFLWKFPNSKDRAEALLLLGDALLDQRNIDEGLAAYRKIPCASLSFHEIAIFRLGKALKKLGKPEELKKEMEHLRKKHPESVRLVDAIREMGGIYHEQKEQHLALQLYWQTVNQYGDHPHVSSMELLLQDLQKLHAAEGKSGDYLKQIQHLQQQALKEKKSTLLFRMAWAESALEKDPIKKAQLIAPFVGRSDMEQASGRILADFADALWAVKNFEQAAIFYQGILKWHPLAAERDRALAGLARMAAQSGHLKPSLSYWRQLQEQVPESRLVPEAILHESVGLMKFANQYSQATSGFQRVLQHDLATRTQKVEALYQLGKIQMHLGQPARAVPYFQRIYIAYGAEKKRVAQAYLQSARAFEILGKKQSMLRTYEEMKGREDLKEFPEWEEAKRKFSDAVHHSEKTIK